MNKLLTYCCGGVNALFTVFHVLLGTAITGYPSLSPVYRGLMQAFNLGGTLMIAFLAFAFLACRSDLGTRLGRGTIVLGAAVFLTRALGEYIFFPAARLPIVIVCVVAGLLHVGALMTKSEPKLA